MLGVWIENDRIDVRRDLPDPSLEPEEAIVRVTLAGICGTDLALLEGYLPREAGRIPGHEFVGVVEEGPSDRVGARVVAEINITCSSFPARDPACSACAAGRPSHCRRRSALGLFGRSGAHAERVAVPVRNLHRVPASVPDEAAVFIEPLAAAFRVLEQVAIGASTRVAVVGPGRLGLLVARAIASGGASVLAVGRSSEGIERCRRAGVEATTESGVGSSAFDVIVDCTGDPSGLRVARKLVRPGGTVVVKSTFRSDAPVALPPVVVDEITIVGSRCGPFPTAIHSLAEGRIEVVDLVDDLFPLSDAVAGYARASESGVAKVLLAP